MEVSDGEGALLSGLSNCSWLKWAGLEGRLLRAGTLPACSLLEPHPGEASGPRQAPRKYLWNECLNKVGNTERHA